MTVLLSAMPCYAATQEEALAYAKSKLNTYVPNESSHECVEYVKDYYKAVFGESVRGNGSDYINNVPSGFKQMLYGSADWDPQPGDIVSWSWNKYGGSYGHVGIISRVDSNGFYYLNQNPYKVKESRYDYGQSGWTLAGAVRPRYDNNAVQETTSPAVQSANTITDGSTYAIISSATGKYMNAYCNRIKDIKNGTTINLYDNSGDDTQRFVFHNAGDNKYLIQPKGSNYTVNVSSLKSGAKLLCWEKNSNNDEYWIAEPSGDGYTFRLVNQSNMYLTQSGSSLIIQAKSGKSNQIFLLAQ